MLLCGHVEYRFTSRCGRKCADPEGPTTYSDKCASCDAEDTEQRHRQRAAEIMEQLKQGKRMVELEELIERATALSSNMREGVASARRIIKSPTNSKARGAPQSSKQGMKNNKGDKGMHDHAATSSPSGSRDRRAATAAGARGGRARDADSDSESDDGNYLTEDGKHVIQKEYQLISGSWAQISYRREPHQVDPDLLLKLRMRRAREARARELRKAEKRRRARGVGGGGNPTTSHHRAESGTHEEAAQKGEVVKERTKERTKGKAIEETPASTPPAEKTTEPAVRQRERPTLQSPSPKCFKERAEKQGFRPIANWHGSRGYESAPERSQAEKQSVPPRPCLRRVKAGQGLRGSYKE
ncbi:hypothetical protein F4802DRAFT_603034 [Xylaria palmicola]|nr:hypothetical protein F4802DRAFT_603034 [Xylaria palmicola]